jgi:hypothetical protein
MEKRSGVTGTVVVSLLTLCCSTICCAAGIYALADQGRTMHLGPIAGTPMILFGILVWTVPPLISLRIVEESEEDMVDEI